MISVEVVHDKTSAVAIRHERDSSAPSVVSVGCLVPEFDVP